MSKHFLSGSIILLSIAIFFFAFQLSNSESVSSETKEPEQSKDSLNIDNGLLSIEAAALYLSMDVEQFNELIKAQNVGRAQLTSYDTYLFIPYIQMNGEMYFSKKQLDEWIDYNILSRQDINY
ncbi:hypothetical protein [Psychrobacillus sp.]|uniref:hypothetical protein n=1 Tax=Psychrobacillus sp. TaxID=1871623 RepID=UPI0028BDE114|nr:hypothetical protein [Psychrobacillus sp.]